MVDYTSLETSDVKIQIRDASGLVFTQQMNSIEAGMNHIKVSNLDALSSGQYFVIIKDLTTGEVIIRKLVK